MNQVLTNVMIEHPCKAQAPGASPVQQTPVAEYNRAKELAEIGEFNLEEGIEMVTSTMVGEQCQFTLEDLRDLNANFGQVLAAVPRNDKNVT